MAGLYLHVPFCTQRCVYCDFYFVTSQARTNAFVRAAHAEIAAYGRRYGQAATRRDPNRGEPLRTIYLGGGTPSLLEIDGLRHLIEAVDEAFDTSQLEEVTIEANPEDCRAATLRAFRDLGVTRLSLGVQSFFPDDLAWMNRAHDAEQAERSVEAVAEHFDDFSVDLIFGVPDQPFEHWGANLEKALRLGAPHLSCYGLTVEPRTPLAKQVTRGLVSPTDDETMRERFVFTSEYLTQRGFEHYEVSSFARPGHRSRHNQRYWDHSNYIGIGPSAHSFWRRTRSWARRWSNLRSLKHYVALLDGKDLPVDEEERLDQDALADEYVMLSLRRLTEGIDLRRLQDDYGVILAEERGAVLEAMERSGLIIHSDDRIRLTLEGAAIADSVALQLIA